MNRPQAPGYCSLGNPVATGLFVLTMLVALGGALAEAGAERDPAAVLQKANEPIHRFTMDNGTVGLIKPDTSAPMVAIQLWFGTGSIHEDNYLGAGLSHYVEHMIFKGTPTRSTGDISREISSAGGRINAYTTLDRTVFHVVMPAARWQTGLDVLADAVQHATFPPDEWEREKQVILREMAMNKDNPQRVLSRLLWSTAFRVHPYKHPVIGYEEVFLQTDRDDLLGFFERHYRPDNMIVSVAGDINVRDVEQQIRGAFAGFQRRTTSPVVIPREPAQLAARMARTTGPYEVARAAWGWHTVPLYDKDAVALDVVAAIVGGGESARLPLAIRDERQLVHSINAWSYTPGQPGLFGITATFDAHKEDAVLEAVADEIERWRTDEPFTKDEIEKAKRQVLVRSLTELQGMRGQAQRMASGEFYAGDPRFMERYLALLQEVTPAGCAEVLNRYIQPERQTLALLAPKQKTADDETEQRDTLTKDPVRLELANGIPLIVREDRRLPLVHLTVAALGGVLSENEDTQGITQFMSQLLPRGTEEQSAQAIAERLDSLGATLTSFSGLNSFGLTGMGLSTDLDELLAIVAESLLHPAFDEQEITRQRARQLAEIRMRREKPLAVADDAVRELLYPEHPYRWTPAGAEATVSAIDRDALLHHLSHHLRSGNIAISLFGAITPDEARAKVEPLFSDIPDGEKVIYDKEVGPRALPAESVQREPREQTILLMAFPGVTLTDPRSPVLDVMQTALSGLSSTLAMEVREKRGLVYFVGAMNRSGLAPGRFALYAGTHEEAVPELQLLMEQEIERLATEGLTEEELSRAQEQLVGDFYSLLQSNGPLAQVSALNELYGLGHDYTFTKESRIRRVTNKAIQEAAQSILDQKQRAISIVYPTH